MYLNWKVIFYDVPHGGGRVNKYTVVKRDDGVIDVSIVRGVCTPENFGEIFWKHDKENMMMSVVYHDFERTVFCFSSTFADVDIAEQELLGCLAIMGIYNDESAN
jgi:hypothetical protein